MSRITETTTAALAVLAAVAFFCLACVAMYRQFFGHGPDDHLDLHRRGCPGGPSGEGTERMRAVDVIGAGMAMVRYNRLSSAPQPRFQLFIGEIDVAEQREVLRRMRHEGYHLCRVQGRVWTLQAEKQETT